MSNIRYLAHKSGAVYQNTLMALYLNRLSKLKRAQMVQYFWIVLLVGSGIVIALMLPLLFSKIIEGLLAS